MRAWLPVLALLLSACTAPDDPMPQGERVVEMEVLSAERVPGRCFDGAEAFGEVYDRLVVRVDNTAFTNDLDVGRLQWEAHDDAGRTIKTPQASHDEIAGGSVADIEVSFTQDDGADPLTTLVYEGFQGQGRAMIPPY